MNPTRYLSDGGYIMASVQAAKKRKILKGGKTVKEAERPRLIDEVMGKYAWVPYSSEDFIRDKRRETALENRV
jgi:hypothetical protein